MVVGGEVGVEEGKEEYEEGCEDVDCRVGARGGPVLVHV